jgi:hypothetical protein
LQDRVGEIKEKGGPGMKIYLASINLGDKPNPRTPPRRLFSFYELRVNLFGIMDVLTKIGLLNKQWETNENLRSSNRTRE